MTGIDNEPNRVREARLLVSSPEVVVEELRKYASSLKSGNWRDKEMERSLLKRNDPLINLALARFATDAEIVGELYKSATQSVKEPLPDRYKKGLRIACLSNEVVKGSFFRRIPTGVLDDEEIRTLFESTEEDEIEALLKNPTIEDELLVQLYRREGRFSDFSDDRWVRSIAYSRSNPRLVTRNDTEDGLDFGHYEIHEAIFRLLEIAPITPHSLRVLYDLFIKLDPSQVSHPEISQADEDEAIDRILKRWASVVIENSKGNAGEGYYTSLSITDEFRALIGALYGVAHDKKQSNILGNPSASDVAMRCAYYGNAPLTPREMQEGYERDKEAFTFAALFNDHVILYDQKQRKLFEDVYLAGRELIYLYRQRCEQIHKRRPNFAPHPVSDLLGSDSIEKNDPVLAKVSTIEDGIANLGKQVHANAKWVLVALAGLAALLLLKR